MAKRAIVVVGGTGAIGREVLRLLAGREDLRVAALVRRDVEEPTPGIAYVRFDFGEPGSYSVLGTDLLPCEVLLCCIGTTRREAGSKDAFRRVDRDIPLRLAGRLAAVNPNAVFGLVSSVGADRPLGFYLQTKAEVEIGLAAMRLPHVIVRPALLLGRQGRVRPMEQLAATTMPLLFSVVDWIGLGGRPTMQRLRPVSVRAVAESLVRYAVDHKVLGRMVLEGQDLAQGAQLSAASAPTR